MNRRSFVSVCVQALALASGLCVPVGWAQSPRPKRIANLEEQLRYGLKARLPTELAFVRRIVELVEEERLPVDAVLAAMNWARKNRQPYPFPYFAGAIRALAARRGIRV